MEKTASALPDREKEETERELNAEPERAVRAGRKLYDRAKRQLGPAFPESEPEDPKKSLDKPFRSRSEAARPVAQARTDPDARAAIRAKSRLAPVFTDAPGDGALGDDPTREARQRALERRALSELADYLDEPDRHPALPDPERALDSRNHPSGRAPEPAPEDEKEEERVDYYRVQLGQGVRPNQRSFERVFATRNGGIEIDELPGIPRPGETYLYVSAENPDHARYYLKELRLGGEVVEWTIPPRAACSCKGEHG